MLWTLNGSGRVSFSVILHQIREDTEHREKDTGRNFKRGMCIGSQSTLQAWVLWTDVVSENRRRSYIRYLQLYPPSQPYLSVWLSALHWYTLELCTAAANEGESRVAKLSRPLLKGGPLGAKTPASEKSTKNWKFAPNQFLAAFLDRGRNMTHALFKQKTNQTNWIFAPNHFLAAFFDRGRNMTHVLLKQKIKHIEN